jgi:hypothetical protein
VSDKLRKAFLKAEKERAERLRGIIEGGEKTPPRSMAELIEDALRDPEVRERIRVKLHDEPVWSPVLGASPTPWSHDHSDPIGDMKAASDYYSRHGAYSTTRTSGVTHIAPKSDPKFMPRSKEIFSDPPITRSYVLVNPEIAFSLPTRNRLACEEWLAYHGLNPNDVSRIWIGEGWLVAEIAYADRTFHRTQVLTPPDWLYHVVEEVDDDDTTFTHTHTFTAT